MWSSHVVSIIRNKTATLWLKLQADYANTFFSFSLVSEQLFVGCGNSLSNKIFVQASTVDNVSQWDVDTSFSAGLLGNLFTGAWLSIFFSTGTYGWSCSSHFPPWGYLEDKSWTLRIAEQKIRRKLDISDIVEPPKYSGLHFHCPPGDIYQCL